MNYNTITIIYKVFSGRHINAYVVNNRNYILGAKNIWYYLQGKEREIFKYIEFSLNIDTSVLTKNITYCINCDNNKSLFFMCAICGENCCKYCEAGLIDESICIHCEIDLNNEKKET